MIKITKISPQVGEFIEVEGTDYSSYIRYSADNWMVFMGESIEPVFNDKELEELEAAYQVYRSEGAK